MIPLKKAILSNFTQGIHSESECVRPETEQEIYQSPSPNLARGSGLSYSDCCFNTQGTVIDTVRFNHFLSFDKQSHILECQAAVLFSDLFYVDSEFIPPVIPGTLHATLGGGIANDVHGKNNHKHGSIGQHIAYMDLIIDQNKIRCSPDKNANLFYSTIGGLGLTGFIYSVGLRMHKAPAFVAVENSVWNTWDQLLEIMQTKGLDYDYQVAWVDLLNQPTRGIISMANHCDNDASQLETIIPWAIPKLPVSLVHGWNMKWYNKLHLARMKHKQILSLQQFNNPLDSIKNWNRLYGPKGLMQFQAVFNQEKAEMILKQLQAIIHRTKAKPCLSVLKLFTQPGTGLLSFCEPGITIAIDFPRNRNTEKAIRAMNQYIVDHGGKVYLAKDLLLNQEQFQIMYANNSQFKQILTQHHCTMRSDIGIRLGLLT